MAGQSITFDFISRGAGQLAGDFKRTGDTAASAAKGAKVLQETIGKLGQKENRTAEESARLASALRLTGDAEDRAAAKALRADIAFRRLADAEAAAAKKAGDARGGFAGLAGEITGFGAAAGVADSKGSLFSKVLAGLNLASGVLEPALAGVVVAAGGLAAGFAAAASGIGVFGVVAKTVLTQASKAATATSAAQDAHAAAVAKVTGQYRIAMSTAKTQAQRNAAYAAEQKGFQTAALNQQVAVNKATAGLSPPVQALAGKLADLKTRWKAFTDAAAPGVTGVLSQGIGILASHFGLLKPFLAPTEKALSGILAKLNTGLNSAGFTSFLGALAKNSGPAITKIATAIGNVVVGIGGILKAFLPTSQSMLSGIDKITAKFREWGTTLSSHSGFQSLMTTFRTETPQAVAILRNLGVVLVNVGKAMFGLSTFSNSKVLLQALLPLSGVLAKLSANTGLVRIALYLYAATTAAVKLKPAMAALFGVDGKGGIIRGAVAAVGWIGKMTKAMLGLDVAMNANVVGLVVIAIAALAIGFAVAWKKSAAFRDAIKDIAKVFLGAGIIIVQVAKALVDSVLSAFGSILHGAATAFGWVPGLGSKLRDASKHFDDFKGHTDNVFDGIIGKMRDWQNSLDASRRTVATATASIVKNFQGQGAAALRGRDDVNTYTAAVQANGTRSDAARAARKRLIGDLERAGMTARDANRLVDNLQGAINRMHGRTVSVIVQGGGKGSITIDSYGVGKVGTTGLKFMASGGAVTGGTPGRDSVLGMLMPGEVIVPAGMVQAGAVDHLRGRLPGFAAGGLVGAIGAAPGTVASAEAAFAGKVEAAFAQRALAALRAAAAAAAGSGGGDIVSYARSFLGKIPYLFGGTSLAGMDCSGFTGMVYRHAGYPGIPRTSEAQNAWVTHTRSPQAGGLAFYHSPGGGADPGHVAIIDAGGGQVISQGGGMGPKIEQLRFLPLLSTGVPPGGFAGNPGPGGQGTLSAQAIENFWLDAGGPGGMIANIAQAITVPESGRRPGAVQQGQPYGSRGWGLWQITPGNSEPQAGINSALLNPHNNAVAAVAKFRQAGGSFRPWTTYMDGAYLPYLLSSGGPGGTTGLRAHAAGGLVQKFDQGGVLRPGVTLAVNNTGRDEQVIPAYASGGAVTTTGPTGGPAATAAYRAKINALERREGADYVGLRRAFLRGPRRYLNRTVYQELLKMHRLQGAEQTAYGHLKGAGLTKVNLDRLGAAARAEQKAALSAVLNRKHGGHPGWASGLRYWLGQLSGVTGKGLPGGQLTSGPHGAGLPAITHTYGGDVTNTIGAFLSSVAAPFTGKLMDRGGWLKPGWNAPMYNATGRPEHLVPATSGGGSVRLEISPGGGSDFEQFMATMIRRYVKVRGGGSVQRAYGAH